jgi:hypothetical protein
LSLYFRQSLFLWSLKSAAAGDVLLGVAIAALAIIVLSQFASSLIMGWFGFAAIPIFFTSFCLFGVLNPSYRRLRLISGVVLVPSFVLLIGPFILDFGTGLSILSGYSGAAAIFSLYALIMAIAGGVISLIGAVVMLLSWSMTKDIDSPL